MINDNIRGRGRSSYSKPLVDYWSTRMSPPPMQTHILRLLVVGDSNTQTVYMSNMSAGSYEFTSTTNFTIGWISYLPPSPHPTAFLPTPMPTVYSNRNYYVEEATLEQYMYRVWQCCPRLCSLARTIAMLIELSGHDLHQLWSPVQWMVCGWDLETCCSRFPPLI